MKKTQSSERSLAISLAVSPTNATNATNRPHTSALVGYKLNGHRQVKRTQNRWQLVEQSVKTT